MRSLRHGYRLARQRRLVHPQFGRTEDPHVGRDAIAGIERDQVAHDQVSGVDAHSRTIADHRGLDAQRTRQRIDRGAGPALLGESDRRIHHHHRGNHDGIDMVAKGEHDRRGDDEQEDQGRTELRRHGHPPWNPAGSDQRIRTVPAQAHGRVGGVEPAIGTRAQRFTCGTRLCGVPRHRKSSGHARMLGAERGR